MNLISPTDALFLVGESREHPMHVAGLQLFEPPADAGPDFVRDLYDETAKRDDYQPTFRKHPGTIFGGISNVAWAFDNDIDIDYHLRRSALPRPGRVRELLELTSRLHGTLLDRHRPLWEASLVEGLEDGRFAVCTAVDHRRDRIGRLAGPVRTVAGQGRTGGTATDTAVSRAQDDVQRADR